MVGRACEIMFAVNGTHATVNTITQILHYKGTEVKILFFAQDMSPNRLGRKYSHRLTCVRH